MAHIDLGRGGCRPRSLQRAPGCTTGSRSLLVAVAARAARGAGERAAWALLALGIACWTLGDITWSVVYAGNPPFPSVADAFYLAFYPPTYLALALLVRRRLSRFNASVWLDGVAASSPSRRSARPCCSTWSSVEPGEALAEATNLAYPLADIVLIALVVGVFGIAGWRPGRGVGSRSVARSHSPRSPTASTCTSRRSGRTCRGRFSTRSGPRRSCCSRSRRGAPRIVSSDGRLEGRPLAATPAICGLVALGVLVDSYVEHRNAAASRSRPRRS